MSSRKPSRLDSQADRILEAQPDQIEYITASRPTTRAEMEALLGLRSSVSPGQSLLTLRIVHDHGQISEQFLMARDKQGAKILEGLWQSFLLSVREAMTKHPLSMGSTLLPANMSLEDYHWTREPGSSGGTSGSEPPKPS